jgi:hypothetical protein
MTRFAVTDPTSTAQWEALSVDLVTPVLAWLAHPSCTRTGEIYEAFGGRVAQVLVGETLGIQDPALSTASIVAGLDAVHDRSRVAYPAHARDIGAAVDAAGGARRAPDAGE